MASYYIDIIDTTSPLTQLVLEDASASGIVLKWNGGDSKDGMAIVTSEFNFDMLTKTAEDAAFVEFYTGDEHRFKVLVRNNADDAVLWQGYVLPDLYSEPYKNGCFFVSFTAVDGLGRLKGKYLSEDYYSREKSLIDICCSILKLTGLELNLYFNPAIENSVNKDWNEIFVDTASFLDKEEKQDAYKILETLLKDTLCVCYQADNRWYIEGINTRHLRQVTYKIYDTEGVFSDTLVYNRLLKNITPLVTPQITIIPPYNEIVVSHKKTPPTFPKSIAKEINDGWAIVSGVVGEIYSSDWIGHGGMLEKCIAPNYNPQINHRGTENNGGSRHIDFPQDNSRFLSLRKKIFYKRGQRINIFLGFNLKRYYQSIPPPENIETWKNVFKYEILFNGSIIYGNLDDSIIYFEDLNFDASGKAELSIDHIFADQGLFDVRIYGLTGILQEKNLEAIVIAKAEIKVFGFVEDQKEMDLINGEFTIDKEVELTFSDDSSGASTAFRLKKLKENTAFFAKIDVAVLHSFVFNGKKYLQVQLAGANLINENRFDVYSASDNSSVDIIDVYYNFNDGDQMIVETSEFYSGLYVKKYATGDISESRLFWEQWTDSIYKIETNSFARTTANIYRRMFNTAHEKMDLTVLNAVKFNDIVLFKYVFEKDFIPLNCEWNLDENKSTLTLGRSYYKDATASPEDENVPPVVVAGQDIYLSQNQNTAVLNASAYDPDGFIVSQIWTKIAGGLGDVIETPLQLGTNLKNLTEDFYTYQIEVTDNDGAKASDLINIYRIITSNITLDLTSEVTTTPLLNYYLMRYYKLNINPNLPVNAIVSFSGLLKTKAIYRNQADSIIAECGVLKNGVIMAQSYIKHGDNPKEVDLSFSFNCISTDNIVFYSRNSIKNDGNNYSYSEINIGSHIVVAGDVVVTGLPIQKRASLGTP
jgi:hypothetical protein